MRIVHARAPCVCAGPGKWETVDDGLAGAPAGRTLASTQPGADVAPRCCPVPPHLRPQVYAWLGVEPPRGVLLHGPPGCGKTALANAIANEVGVPFLRVSAPEIVSGMSGG